MHLQKPPHSERKLVRCVAGSIFDVIIDLRKNSSTFLKWFGVELSAENKKMIYIPEGFAHGFQSLADNTELIYHHSDFHEPNFEVGIRYDDRMLDIKWPQAVTIVSEKDKHHPLLTKDFEGINILS
jgi:dTDP-4-dehydrorhamnose 3,5-epimerase